MKKVLAVCVAALVGTPVALADDDELRSRVVRPGERLVVRCPEEHELAPGKSVTTLGGRHLYYTRGVYTNGRYEGRTDYDFYWRKSDFAKESRDPSTFRRLGILTVSPNGRRRALTVRRVKGRDHALRLRWRCDD